MISDLALTNPFEAEEPTAIDHVADLFGPVSSSELSEYDMRMLAAQEDFGDYMRLVFPDYVEGWHLDELREALVRVYLYLKDPEDPRGISRLIVTMPPRHSKSMHVSEGFPAWIIGKMPHKKVISCSHTQPLANKFSRRVRNTILRNGDWPFKDVTIARDNSSVEEWAIEGVADGGYAAVGRGGSPTGRGGDLIIIDDPIKGQADADSETIRETVWEWFTGTLYTRRQPNAAIVVTTTRWHEDDLTGRLLQREKDGGEKWHHLNLPAQSDDGSYLWTEYWAPKEYELAKNSSERVWNAQYMGRPGNKDGNLIVRPWFGDAPYGERYLSVVQSWDTAEEPGLSNDWSVCTTIGVTAAYFDILHIWRAKVSFPDLVDAAHNQITWGRMSFPGIPFEVIIEKKSSGVQLYQTLQKQTTIPVTPIPVPNVKHAKIQRVIDVTPTLRSGRVRILRGQAWVEPLLKEMASFPYGQNDDQVDSAIGVGIRYVSGVGGVQSAQSKNYMEDEETDEPVRQEPRRRRPQPPRRQLASQHLT